MGRNADDGIHRSDLSPHAQSVWLPTGTPRVIHLDEAAAEALGVRTDGAPVAVEIGFDAAGEVVALVDGRIVGELDGPAGMELSPSLRLLESRGLIALAHGVFSLIDGSPALTIHADPLGPARSPSSQPSKHNEDFAADAEAEAAAKAADAERTPSDPTGRKFEFVSFLNMQMAAVLCAAIALGVVGFIAYYTSTGEHAREINAYVNDSSASKATNSSPSSPASSSSETTSAEESPSSETETSPAEPAPANPNPNPVPDQQNYQPLPQTRPHVDPGYVPPAPAPAPAPTPAPAAPAPAPQENPNAPAPVPILEFQW